MGREGRIKRWIQNLNMSLDLFRTRMKSARLVMSRKRYVLIVEDSSTDKVSKEREWTIDVRINNATPEIVTEWCEVVAGATVTMEEMDSSVEEANRIIKGI